MPKWAAPPGMAQARPCLGWGQLGRYGLTYTLGRTVSAHGLHTWPKHGPIRLGRAEDTTAYHASPHNKSNFPPSTHWTVSIWLKNKSILYSSCLWASISLFYIPPLFLFDHAVPDRSTVPREWPKHSPAVGSGRHEHDPGWAVTCLGRAKLACLGLGRGSRAIWPSISIRASSSLWSILVF